MGPDDVHPEIFKYLSNESFFNSISKLFEKCIEYEMIPSIWKTAIVIWLHKNGLIHLKSNNQPDFLTCILCKVLEKSIWNHLLNFIGENMNFNQLGFVYSKSTLSNTLESIDIINEYLIEGDNVDFSKAFDMVPHSHLLVKMKNLDISKRNILSCQLGL